MYFIRKVKEETLDVRSNLGGYQKGLREPIPLAGGALPQKLHEIKSVDERQSRNYRDWDGWDGASRAVWIPDEDRIQVLQYKSQF